MNGGFLDVIGSLWSDVFDLFQESIKRPSTAAKDVARVGRSMSGLIIAVVEMLLIFITFLIHLPLGEISRAVPIEFRYKAAVGGYVCSIVILYLVVVAIAANVVKDSKNPDYTFVNILGMYGTATAPGIIYVALIFFVGFFSSKLVVCLLLLSTLSWMYSSHNITRELIAGDEDKKNLLANIISILVAFIVLFVLYKLGNSKGISTILYGLL